MFLHRALILFTRGLRGGGVGERCVERAWIKGRERGLNGLKGFDFGGFRGFGGDCRGVGLEWR